MSKTRIVFISLFTLATLFTAIFSCFLIDNAQNQFPPVTQLNYNFHADKPPLTVNEMLKLIDEAALKDVSFCAQAQPVSVKEELIVPVLTNESYFSYYYKDRVTGNGITQDMITQKSKYAVISSALARKLFFHSDAIGNKIVINNDRYTVCGIYQQSERFINQVSSDNLERVYLPYTSSADYGGYNVDMISYGNKTFSAPLIEQMNLLSYYATNFSEKGRVITDFLHVLFLLLYAGICIVMLTIWRRGCSKLFLKIRDGLQSQYLLSFFKAKPHIPILLFLMGLGIPVLLTVVFISGNFSIYVIPKYIPNDNIFDVSYYINALIKSAQTFNSASLSGDTELIHLYSNTFHILLVLMFLFMIELIAFLTTAIRKLNKTAFLNT